MWLDCLGVSGENIEEGDRKRDRKSFKAHISCPVSVSSYYLVILVDLLTPTSDVLVTLPCNLVRAKRLGRDRLEEAKARSLPASFPVLSALALVYSLRLFTNSNLCLSFQYLLLLWALLESVLGRP